jgi:hypothetical protein
LSVLENFETKGAKKMSAFTDEVLNLSDWTAATCLASWIIASVRGSNRAGRSCSDGFVEGYDAGLADYQDGPQDGSDDEPHDSQTCILCGLFRESGFEIVGVDDGPEKFLMPTPPIRL